MSLLGSGRWPMRPSMRRARRARRAVLARQGASPILVELDAEQWRLGLIFRGRPPFVAQALGDQIALAGVLARDGGTSPEERAALLSRIDMAHGCIRRITSYA